MQNTNSPSILKPFPEGLITNSGNSRKRKKVRTALKVKILLGVVITSLLLFGAFKTVEAINNFFENNTFVFRPIVEFQFNKPLSIIKRVPKTETIVQIINQLQPLDGVEKPIEKYICEKFGAYDCKTAIAIARAESGSREDAFHANDNGSIDVGIFQINSVHFNKPGCSLKEIVNAEKNVDCAYQIWKSSGWNAWTVYKTGAFTTKLNNL